MHTWTAVYQDGTHLTQYDPAGGPPRSTEAIDRAHLAAFVLQGEDGTPVYVQHLKPGQRLIYRKRTENETGRSQDFVAHLIGWQETVYTRDGRPRNVQHIAHVWENGHIEATGRFYAGHPWFSPIEPRPADAIVVEG
jgi:hypothetical protein